MGIGNDKARIHIELNKDPNTIEEAVQKVITFMETTKYPQHDDEQYFNKRRFVRQVTRTDKDTSDWKTGKLNRKRPLTTQKEQKADYGASTCHQSVDMQQIQQKRQYPNEHMRNNSFQKENAQMGQSSQSQPFLCFMFVADPVTMLDNALAILRGGKTSSLNREIEKHYLSDPGIIRSRINKQCPVI
jgi:hypothetical protein